MYSVCVNNDYITGVLQSSQGKKIKHKEAGVKVFFISTFHCARLMLLIVCTKVIQQSYTTLSLLHEKNTNLHCHNIIL